MQPTYLPWAGYFHLMSQADRFVLLDDAQFERSSWHHRNRVLLASGPAWLTVPVRRLYLGQGLHEVAVDDRQPWRAKHQKLLRQAYGGHPHGAAALEAIAPLTDPGLTRLADLNIALLSTFADRLGLSPPVVRSSALGIKGRRTERLIMLCEHLGCDEYLSPCGAAAYLEADRFVERTTIRLSFQEFAPDAYAHHRQAGHVSHLSILDVVANLGWEAASRYVRGLAPAP